MSFTSELALGGVLAMGLGYVTWLACANLRPLFFFEMVRFDLGLATRFAFVHHFHGVIAVVSFCKCLKLMLLK